DHFCVRSLDRLDRETVIYHRRGAQLIELALKRLGFANVQPLAPGQDDVTIADLRLISTASQVSFPEMGVVFCHDGVRFWNLIDTILDETIKSSALAQAGPIDLLFAPFQPLIQELSTDALGAGFPF